MIASHAAIAMVPGRTYRNIAGALAIEMLHCSAGVALSGSEVVSWKGQLRGLIVPAPSVPRQPPYAVDGTAFGGKPVIQMATATNKYLRGTGMPVLFATGSLPWVFTIARFRIVNSNALSALVDAGVTAVSDDLALRISDGNAYEASWSAGHRVIGGAANTARRSMQAWPDGTYLNLSVDNGTPTQLAASGGITHNTTTLGIGCCAGALDTQVTTASIALLFACSVRPAAARVAEIEALALAEFPP